MRKLFSIIIILIFAIVAAACGNNGGVTSDATTTGNGPGVVTDSATGGTTGGTVEEPTEQRKPLNPPAPVGLEERVRYECVDGTVYTVKGYFDESGKCIEEHHYSVNIEFGVVDCVMIVYNTYDGGALARSEVHYRKNPCYGERETVLYYIAIDHDAYDYKIENEFGETELYMVQVLNADTYTVTEKYFDENGRFVREESAEFTSDGILKRRVSRDVWGRVSYECTYNQLGNFAECKVYDETNRICKKVNATYYKSGVMSSYKSVPITDGIHEGVPTEITFNQNGNINRGPGFVINYRDDGTVHSVYHNVGYTNKVKFDKFGYIIEYNKNPSGIMPQCKIVYTYNSDGKLTSSVYRENTQYKVTEYTYGEDGSSIITVRNKLNLIEQVVKTDARGDVIEIKLYDGKSKNDVSKIQTFEYDEKGFLISSKICNANGTLDSEYSYEYNEYGDLVQDVYNQVYSSGSYMVESNEYEYFENGCLKIHTTYNADGIRGRIEYYKDGGYTREYYFEGEICESQTHDVYGNLTKSFEIDSHGKHLINVYTYFSNREIKTVMTYVNGVLEEGYEYAENRHVLKEYKTDENGVVITKEYIFENRIIRGYNTYEDGVLTKYTLIEYFRYSSYYDYNIKTEKTYNTEGELIYLVEYTELKYTEYGLEYMDYVILKEEAYENGEVVGYVYYDYDVAVNGKHPVSRRTKKGSYTAYGVYNKFGQMIEEYRYTNGVLTSFYERTHKNVQSADGNYSVTEYDENGKTLKKFYYVMDGPEIKLGEYELYSYYESGALHTVELYWGYHREHYPKNTNEYYESGVLKTETFYFYTTSDTLYKTEESVYYESGVLKTETVCFYSAAIDKAYKTEESIYNEDGLLIREKTRGSTRSMDIFYEYNEKKQLVSKLKYSGAVLGEETFYKYHENGVMAEKLYYHGRTVSIETYEKILDTFNENGDPLYHCRQIIMSSDGSVSASNEDIYTYNDMGLLTEKLSKSNGSVTLREVNGYYDNGSIKSRKHYSHGELVYAVYYDEDGNVIMN